MLSLEEYRQRANEELYNAEQWISKMYEGYNEIIITSDHYPFGTDCPICMWIKKDSDKTHYKIYGADWNLFEVDCLPNKFLVNDVLAKESDKFFIRKTNGKYGWDVVEVEPFGFVEKEFKNGYEVSEGNSIRELLDNELSYVMEECEYEQYLEYCNEDKKDIEANKAEYEITEFSRIEKDDKYCGGLYLNLYLVARR